MSFNRNLPPMEFGAAFEHAFRYWVMDENRNKIPANLTGYGAVMDIKADGAVVLRLSTANGRIYFSGHEIHLTVQSSDTLPLSFDEADYDLLLLPGNDPEQAKRLVWGIIPGAVVTTTL